MIRFLGKNLDKNNMSNFDKKLGVESLIGKTISGFSLGEQELDLFFKDDTKAHIVLEDDGGGTGNDSHAYFERIDFAEIIGKEIIGVEEQGHTSYGVLLILKTKDGKGEIDITHEHNGYYGFNYEIFLT